MMKEMISHKISSDALNLDLMIWIEIHEVA